MSREITAITDGKLTVNLAVKCIKYMLLQQKALIDGN